ncbi:WhiB family transcriptional regulator [Schumannella soli]|uniref:Transcriptional regulator WhiB n=1 Tax=Schumannella soli TaxID=2590779 RepID=A0A506XWT5_9MICO|nr:WhiB family transcriptional regulator [Schumannella soli]TPW77221.1 WhiB family transcriptional regulator [Schumannella soli]
MAIDEYRPHVPDDWFVDPVRLGIPGVRKAAVDEEENQLSWQSDALCAQTDPEAFFPEKGGSTRDAKKICTGCEVRSECLQYALENDERFGIWGGLSERERRKLRRNRIA